ncbi:GD15339 [Drosophila simulans]|uniref:GD15339 n=1 Tax=Drosophila simulans TaxID=7240 RepID=B4NS39_DROSI|nr:GD15339 [Drosophila simulans]
MEDILGVLGSLSDLRRELEVLRKAHFEELDHLFYGTGQPEAEVKPRDSAPAAKSQENSSVTPQQTKKRPKRLTSLAEDQNEPEAPDATANNTSARQSTRVSNSQLLAIAEDEHNSTASLMPPPPVPVSADTTFGSGRPQRAAKLKTEKLLKEPSLNRKMRRPSSEELASEEIKLAEPELEEPAEAAETAEEQKPPEEASVTEDVNTTKTLRVKVKREKLSTEAVAPLTNAVSAANVTTVSSVTTEAARPDDTVASNTTTSTEVSKKVRKKKKDVESHRPIKVERFSDLDKSSPVSSRTRKCSTDSRTVQERSIYKDALEDPPVAEPSVAAVAPPAVNETVTISNATLVLGPAPTSDSPIGPAGDATFEVHSSDKKQPLKLEEPAEAAETAEEQKPPEEASVTEDVNTTKTLRVKVKREKLSTEAVAPLTNAVSAANVTTVSSVTTEAARPDDTVASNTTTSTEVSKKVRKKKKDVESHRPIKVERFSDLDKSSPVSSRTRKCSTDSRTVQERSIYKDALEDPPVAEPSVAAVAPPAVNETVTISNATLVLGPAPTSDSPIGPAGDATFEVHSSDKKQPLSKQDSLLTEDESVEEKLPTTKLLSSIKAIKLPTRTHELFNPLLQSPVKMRVEAFENAANAQNSMRPKRGKDVQSTPGSNNTPKIGKLPAPTVGRFFTPTQTTSTLPLSSAQPKKGPASASKATSLLKTATGTNLRSVNSTSTKTLSRENSGDDFRKGLHNLAEERKKLREQKHQQAAQQREAKERERAERMAKLAAERAKKQEERKRIEERKRQELEELQRKMRQQEEAEALKKAKLKELEQQKLQQLTGAKPKKMLPPPPKTKYTWEMLHEDDSTDDEGKVTHKRPPSPTWSRSHVRGEAIAHAEPLPN